MTAVKVKIKSGDDTLKLDADGVRGNYRGGKGISVSGNVITAALATATTRTVEDHVGNDTLTNAESGSVHTNFGAAGTITLTLPDPVTDCWFTFCVQAAQALRIDPGAAAIRDDVNFPLLAGKYLWADAVGEGITLASDFRNGDWYTIGKRGSWSREA